MTERELRLLLDVGAVKRVQVHYAVMSTGYMVVVDGLSLIHISEPTRPY